MPRPRRLAVLLTVAVLLAAVPAAARGGQPAGPAGAGPGAWAAARSPSPCSPATR